MRKTFIGTALAAAFTISTIAPVAAAAPALEVADGSTATITGSVGERQTDGSSLRLRYVGDPAPAGYTGNYQRGKSILTASPEETPVTMSGALDVSGMTVNGQTAVIGLHDAEALANGETGHKQEVGIYVTYRSGSGGYYDVGVTDGDAGGGEWVQSFTRISASDLPEGTLQVEFIVDGAADPATCASAGADVASADGCMTLTVNGETVEDSYGTISPNGISTELGNGAHPGWYTAYPAGAGPEIGVLFDLSIAPAETAPQSKDQCKDGNFSDYNFKNQGQCIAGIQANGKG